MAKKLIKKIAAKISNYGNTPQEIMRLDPNGLPIWDYSKNNYAADTSTPAQRAAALSAAGHVMSQTLETSPVPIPKKFTNGLDLLTTIPDIFYDGAAAVADSSPSNIFSLAVDFPEVLPGKLDDAVANAGFLTDVAQASGISYKLSPEQLEAVNKYREYIKKFNPTPVGKITR